MKYLICNLKNKQTLEDVYNYTKNIDEIDAFEKELVFIPSFPFLRDFKHGDYKLGSQDVSAFSDTITGEVTAKQLKSVDVEYVLVGHSERRKYKKEINIDFINKINNALEENLNIIYCIGETLTEREKNEVYNVLERQISEVLNNVPLKNIIVAYEPVWAIGTGITPKISEITDTVEYIKDIIEEKYELNLPVIYGGSITPDNLKEISSIDSLDGILVGGSSLNIENVKKMLEIIK